MVSEKQPTVLIAREDFKSGEKGYATEDTVAHARGGFVPEGGFVRALEDIRRDEKGRFEELEPE